MIARLAITKEPFRMILFYFLSEAVRCGASQKKGLLPTNKKLEFKQMVARLAKIPEAEEYLAYFSVSGIERNAANAA